MNRPTFELAFTAMPEHIDELGHVNNAVWVDWVQQVATAHWMAGASPEQIDRYVWVVTRHEIDYLRPALIGDVVTARSWVGEPKGARFDRFIRFENGEGKEMVRSHTVWAMIDRTIGRPARVPQDVVARFFGES